MEAFSLTFNNSGNSLSKLTTNDIFEILSLSWFQNYPWMLDLVKKWLRYWWLKRRLQFPNRPSLSIQVAAARAPRGEVYLGWASLPRHSATEFLLVKPMHKRRETYQNRRASPLCFGNFFLSGKVLYQCAVYRVSQNKPKMAYSRDAITREWQERETRERLERDTRKTLEID